VADRKISDLTALTTPATGDLIPIVDISEAAAADKNKSITVGELLRGAPDGTAAAPGIAFESDGGNGMFLGGTDILAFSTGGTQAVTIDASRRVGLGTTTPGSYDSNSDDFVIKGGDPGITLATDTTYGTINFADSTAAGDQYRGYIQYAHNVDKLFIGAGGSTGLVIDSSQRVGIGTASPSDTNGFGNALDVNGTTGSAVYIRTNASATDFGLIGHYGTSFYVNNNSNGPTLFFTNGNEHVRIDSSGRLLVGTSTSYGVGSSAAAQLQTGDTAGGVAASFTSWSSFDDGGIIALGKAKGGSVGNYTILSDGDTVGQIRFAAADGTDLETNAALIQCQIDGTPGANDMPGRLKFSTTADGASSPTERMTIKANGNVEFRNGGIVIISTAITSGAGNSTLKYNTTTGAVTYDTSSRLVKENIVDCPYGLDAVKLLQPRKYFRTDDQRDEIGFIADELVSILPEFVPIGPKSVITKNEQDTEDVPLGVNYEKLTAVLTKALQEALAKIETLEQRLNDAGIA
jgi:hypothetical protein